MSWLDGLRAALRPVWRRYESEREIEEELAFHVERETEKNLAAGMSPREARRAARASFGGGIRHREAIREAWPAFSVDGLRDDVRYGIRRLAKRPGFTAAAVLTLALGIGATTAVFSLVKSLLLESLPYPEADELAVIWVPGEAETWLSLREALAYERDTRSFAALAAYTDFPANLTGEAEAEPERVPAAALTAGALDLLGVPPLHGRGFVPQENDPGRDDVVVLSHGLWQRRFGGDPAVVGRSIRVNGDPRTVRGVMPPGFRLPLDYRLERPTELFVPAAIDRTAELPWGDRSHYVFGRLASGSGFGAATDDLARAWRTWAAGGFVDEDDGGLARRAIPLRDLLVGDVRPALFLLSGAVAFMLLIACANVAHLLLARSDARRSEVAMQAALGASRPRLVRQFLVEGGLLAALGAGLGTGLAIVGVRTAVALTPVTVIRMRGVELDPAVLGFAVAVAVVATLLAGLAPALQLSRADLTAAMRLGPVGGLGPRRRALRRALVIGETALSLVLVLGAALLARSFIELRRVDLGFDPSNTLAFQVVLPSADFPETGQVVGFYRELVDRLERLPGAESAAAARIVPLSAEIGDWSITIEGRPAAPGENPNGDWQIVTPRYFETLRLERVAGRFLHEGDDEDAPLVAVVNRTMAERYWPGGRAVGARFHLGTADQPWVEIVGVTRDVRHNAVVEEPRAEMYLSHAQWARARGDGSPRRSMALLVRATGDPRALAPAAREQVRALAPSLPVAGMRTVDEIAAAALAEPRFTAVLLGVFAALALALAGIGLYGVTAYTTARRTNELGIRLALGARRRRLAGLVLREALAMAGTGSALGLLGALWLTRFLAGQLYGVGRLDPATFLAVPLVLLGVAALAAYLPARRAALVSPTIALRAE